jgi:hypothetical protein
MKAFKTAAKGKTTRTPEGDPVVFSIDEDEYTAYRPKDASFVFLAAAADGDRSGMDTAIEISRFLDSCLEPKDALRITKRLRDPADTLDLETLVEVFNHLVSEFTGRPTGSQSA